MKALATTKLVEVTLVLAIEMYESDPESVCGMDYLNTIGEAKIIGWNERTLIATYEETAQ